MRESVALMNNPVVSGFCFAMRAGTARASKPDVFETSPVVVFTMPPFVALDLFSTGEHCSDSDDFDIAKR